MRTSDFDYHLPPERIAQRPADPRDAAKLMIVHRRTGTLEHRVFRDLPEFLRPGDLLVANDTRVVNARLVGRKLATGGAVEVLLLRRRAAREWEALVRGRVRPGTRLALGTVGAQIVELLPGGRRVIRFDDPIGPRIDELGEIPLPPYIKQPLADDRRYQTIYACAPGSTAAPTAGLHFTTALLSALESAGVGIAYVTLHIGLDTFQPVETETIEAHRIHREWCVLPEETASAIRATRQNGCRVVAVGTTSVRVLETAMQNATQAEPEPFAGWTGLYITPPYRFRAVDALVTNFHFPRSTLLMLVAAFAGKKLIDRAYRAALDGQYRFYSFGDAMLIL